MPGTIPVPAQNATDLWWQWAYGVLNGIGAPTSQTNINTLWNWSIKESGKNPVSNGSIQNNPLNTTQRESGSTSANSVGVQSYPDISTGILGTTQTLLNGYYPSIVTALRNSVPTSQWGGSPSIVSELGTWGSGTNWLGNSATPPAPSAYFQTTHTAASQTGSTSTGNPVQDAINAALSPVGNAISSGTATLVEKATYAMITGVGVLLMLGGLALIAVMAIQRVPEPIKRVAGAAANVTPAGRAVSVAKAAKGPAPSAAPSNPAGKPPLSSEAQASMREARAGRGTKLSPNVKRELRDREVRQ